MRPGLRRLSWAACTALGVFVVATACSGSKSTTHGITVPSTGASSTQPGRAPSTGASTTTPQNQIETNVPGDIPDNQVYVEYAPPSGGYAVKVPEGWARTASGSSTVFTDHYNTVNLAPSTSAASPTLATVRTNELPALQKSTTGFHELGVRTVPRTAGMAVLLTYNALSPSDPVTGKRVLLDVERYEFWRNGKLVSITLSASHGSDNVDPWKNITNSFRWTA